MTTVTITLLSFLISASAFTYGAVKTFRKGIPMYFQLMICATGCFALRELWYVINSLCGNPDGVNIGFFASMGCFLFLLSANYGQMDSIVDDGTQGKKYGKKAHLAPMILILLTLAMFISQGVTNPYFVFLEVLIMTPAYIGSYFNLKHLLLPVDDFGFLKASRWCNITSLVFIGVFMIYMFFMREFSTLTYAADLAMSMVMALLALSAERGIRTWKALI